MICFKRFQSYGLYNFLIECPLVPLFYYVLARILLPALHIFQDLSPLLVIRLEHHALVHPSPVNPGFGDAVPKVLDCSRQVQLLAVSLELQTKEPPKTNLFVWKDTKIQQDFTEVFYTNLQAKLPEIGVLCGCGLMWTSSTAPSVSSWETRSLSLDSTSPSHSS